MSPPTGQPTGRSEIIDATVRAASRQLAEIGPARMTVRTVADEAGVNHALVHRHLGTKDHLIGAALDLLADECLDEIDLQQGLRGLTTSAHPRLRRYVTALARCLLDPEVTVSQTHFPVLDRLIEAGTAAGLDDDTARARAVAIQSIVFGIELFGPHVARAASLDPRGQTIAATMIDEGLALLEPLDPRSKP